MLHRLVFLKIRVEHGRELFYAGPNNRKVDGNVKKDIVYCCVDFTNYGLCGGAPKKERGAYCSPDG